MPRRVQSLSVSAYQVVLGSVALTAFVLLLVARDKGVTSGVIQAVVAVGTAYFTVAGLLRREEGRRYRGAYDEEMCQQLTEIIGARCDRIAAERRLINRGPIPLSWVASQDGISGPVTDAVGEPSNRRRFKPLPGCRAVRSTELREGLIRDLHTVYAGLDSGRIAVVGGPGAGKSVPYRV